LEIFIKRRMDKINFTPFPALTTERLILRRLSVEDENEIYAIRSDERVNKYLDRQSCTSLDEALKFINKINAGILNNECIYWAVSFKDNQKLIGTICLWNISDDSSKADIGFELLPEYQGKGIMQEAAKAVIEYGFNIMGLKRIEGEVAPGNTKSINLMRKFNFKLKDNNMNEGVPKVVIYELINL
jgi:ribosomal-protein-alanine N-acetyltransferase